MKEFRDITVTYHRDPPYGWWFESADIPRWTGVGASLREAYDLAVEGVAFALETHAVRVTHRLAEDEPAPLDGSSNAASDEVYAATGYQTVADLEAVGVEPRAEFLRIPVAG